MAVPAYGITEWYGQSFAGLNAADRQRLAAFALRPWADTEPPCPFRPGHVCKKQGGVCTIRPYEVRGGRLDGPTGPIATICPHRFAEDNLLPRWLGEIAGFGEVYVATEVAFSRNPNTGKAAGRIDVVLAGDSDASDWIALEVQAVYFSGRKMADDFNVLATDSHPRPPLVRRRRPDWRSSTKRLNAQLEVTMPILRAWGKKMAVAVDAPFFDSIGGPSLAPSQDLSTGDTIWLVPLVTAEGLVRRHWEVLPFTESREKLLAATMNVGDVDRDEFEDEVRRKLVPVRT